MPIITVGLMGARTLLYKMMVVSPIFFIVWIAGTGRFRSDGFQFVACTVKQQQAISEYRPFVAEAERLEFEGKTPGAIRKTCLSWLKGYEDKKLRELTPVDLSDSVDEGIKRQILLARDGLIFSLRNLARHEAAAGKSEEAFEDFIIALQVAHILKGSDATSERISSKAQADILRDIQDLVPDVSVAHLKSFLVAAGHLGRDQNSLDRIIRQFGVMVLQNSKSNSEVYGEWAPLLENAKSGVIMPSGLIKAITSQPKRLAGVPPPLAELYLANNAHNDFLLALRQVSDKVSVLLNKKNVATASFAQLNL